MKVHDVKCWPMFFKDVWSGAKTAEVRRDDRGYEPGDALNQHEYDPHGRAYLGRVVHQEITHVVRGPVFGLAEGWCVLSTEIVGRTAGFVEQPVAAPAGNLDGIRDLDI